MSADQPLLDNSAAEILERGFEDRLLPSEKKAEAMRELYHSASNYLNVAEGSVAMSVISQELTVKKSVVCPEELDVPCFVIMQYGVLYAFLITFYPMENGMVSINGQEILSRSADELNIPLD